MMWERLPVLMASAEWRGLPARTVVVLLEAMGKADGEGGVRILELSERFGWRTVYRAVGDLLGLVPPWVSRRNGVVTLLEPVVGWRGLPVVGIPLGSPSGEEEGGGEEKGVPVPEKTEGAGAGERRVLGGSVEADPLVMVFYREAGRLLAVRRRTAMVNENAYAEKLRRQMGEEGAAAFLRYTAHRLYGMVYSIRVAEQYRSEWNVVEGRVRAAAGGVVGEVAGPAGPVAVYPADRVAERKLDRAKAALMGVVSVQAFDTWIGPLRATEASSPYFRVVAGTSFAASWVREQYGEVLGLELGAEVLVEAGFVAEVAVGLGGEGLFVGDGAVSSGGAGVAEPAGNEEPVRGVR